VDTNFSVDFMSKHSEKYSQLKNNRKYIEVIAAQEVEISKRKQCLVPESKIVATEDQLKDGDILGITTNIQGLDIQHVVLAFRKNGRIHMLHASQKYMKVLVSDETLEDYLKAAKSATGIVVARPY
jgi:phosphoenolpyruvate synthase/pyruvate phosphate dikinase